jgi:hypothetical protein
MVGMGTRRGLTALCLLACLALAAVAAGCGDSGDSSTTEGGSTATTTETSPAAGDNENGASNPQSGKAAAGGGGSKNSGEQDSAGKPVGESFSSEEPDPAQFKAPKGGDDSIQTYGSEAEGDEREAVLTAMHAFLTALAEEDYKGVCDGITSANRQSLDAFLKANNEQGSCEAILPRILAGGTSEATKAANGAIYQVRLEGENAFVLFKPEGGTASYFVMKKEDGEWKSTSISAGTPFNPVAGP